MPEISIVACLFKPLEVYWFEREIKGSPQLFL